MKVLLSLLLLTTLIAVSVADESSDNSTPLGWGLLLNGSLRPVEIELKYSDNSSRITTVESMRGIVLQDAPEYSVRLKGTDEWRILDVSLPTRPQKQHDAADGDQGASSATAPLLSGWNMKVFAVDDDADKHLSITKGFPEAWTRGTAKRIVNTIEALGISSELAIPTKRYWTSAFAKGREFAVSTTLQQMLSLNDNSVRTKILIQNKVTTDQEVPADNAARPQKSGNNEQEGPPVAVTVFVASTVPPSPDIESWVKTTVSSALELEQTAVNITAFNNYVFFDAKQVQQLVAVLDHDLVDPKTGKVRFDKVALRVQTVFNASDAPMSAITYDNEERFVEVRTKWLAQGIRLPAAFQNQNAEWRIVAKCKLADDVFARFAAVDGGKGDQRGKSSDESDAAVLVDATIEIRTKYRSQNRFILVPLGTYSGFSVMLSSSKSMVGAPVAQQSGRGTGKPEGSVKDAPTSIEDDEKSDTGLPKAADQDDADEIKKLETRIERIIMEAIGPKDHK